MSVPEAFTCQLPGESSEEEPGGVGEPMSREAAAVREREKAAARR